MAQPHGMQVRLLDECTFRLDGGAMFGHVPKAVWAKSIAPDAENRIPLACRLLLVRHDSGRNILVETGMGSKWPAREAALYALQHTPMAALLAAHGLAPADITDVILTHLHLDHAGGATVLDAEGRPVPQFPNARHWVQRGEWAAAMNPDMRSRPSYRAENFLPLEAAGLMSLLDGGGEIAPGIRVRVTPGHTRFHQSVLLGDPGGPQVWYLGDIVPTSHHARPHYVMGYDLYPLDVMATRSALFREAAEAGALCVFEHDAQVPLGRLRADGKGYAVEPVAAFGD